MSSLIEVLKEQSSFGFTGKVNVLTHDKGQFLGVVYQHDGLIVGASFNELKNKKALVKMIFDDVENNYHFKFIVEPELLSPEVMAIKISVDELKTEIQKHYQEYIASKKLKPPGHVKLVIDPEVIVSPEELTSMEFEVLMTISEWAKVQDIYKYCKLLDFEITNALVSLRKKKALKVFQG